MIIRWFWRDCNFRGKKWGAIPIDAFFVEATKEEATAEIFPILHPVEIAESRELAERFLHLAEELGTPARPYCYLVARDLSTIDPFHVHYPFHQLWNGYSPFEEIEEVNIQSLEETRELILPITENS
jgi:hypothetical protein